MTHTSLYVLAALACNLIRENGRYRLPFADPGIDGPGTTCPWPFDPWTLWGAPLGQYHCPYCGSMVVAGCSHPDYTEETVQ